MKRKITEIEQKLLENDYYLLGKQYSGKHSEKTQYFIYINGNNVIKLDYTRTKVIDFGLGNLNIGASLDKTALLVLNTKFKALNEFVASLCPQKEEKCLETPEIEEENLEKGSE